MGECAGSSCGKVAWAGREQVGQSGHKNTRQDAASGPRGREVSEEKKGKVNLKDT